MAWMAGIPERIGYRRDGRGFLLTRAISVPEPGDIPRHERFYYLELLRRAGIESSAPLIAGRMALDLEEHTVTVDQGVPVRLTKLELRLLQMLLTNAGRSVNSDRLLVQVWGHKNSGDRQLLKQLVHRLRQKIEVDPARPAFLQTAAGSGYKLIVE